MSTLDLDDMLSRILKLYQVEFPGYSKAQFARYVVTWLERQSGYVGSYERAKMESELDKEMNAWCLDMETWQTRGVYKGKRL